MQALSIRHTHSLLGVGTIHEATNQTATPLLDRNREVVNRVESELEADTSIGRKSQNLDDARLTTAHTVLIVQSNSRQELCSIWTGLCPLVSARTTFPSYTHLYDF